MTSGPAIERSGDLAAILTSLAEGDVLFIDEIHRIAKPAEELLYSAMEDFRVDVVVGKGPGATAIPLDVEPFTLVGATTRSGLLTGPMRDRFGFVAHLDFYAPADLEVLLHRSARILGVPITDEGAVEIAGRSRGTPRIANRLLRRVRDFAEVRADGVVTLETARAALTVYDVDALGLDRLDRAVLTALVDSFRGGPVGLSTLAVAVGEQPDTVEEVCEPFLVRAGLLARTPAGAGGHRGRLAPSGAYSTEWYIWRGCPSRARSVLRVRPISRDLNVICAAFGRSQVQGLDFAAVCTGREISASAPAPSVPWRRPMGRSVHRALRSSGWRRAGGLTPILMIALLFGVMYFMMIRPQQKRRREAEADAVRARPRRRGGHHRRALRHGHRRRGRHRPARGRPGRADPLRPPGHRPGGHPRRAPERSSRSPRTRTPSRSDRPPRRGGGFGARQVDSSGRRPTPDTRELPSDAAAS